MASLTCALGSCDKEVPPSSRAQGGGKAAKYGWVLVSYPIWGGFLSDTVSLMYHEPFEKDYPGMYYTVAKMFVSCLHH